MNVISQVTLDDLNNLNFMVMLVLMIVIGIMILVIPLFIDLLKRKRSLPMVISHNEPVIMRPEPEPEPVYMEPVSDKPECFRKLYNGNSYDCKACGIRDECSGKLPKRNVVVVPRRMPVEK